MLLSLYLGSLNMNFVLNRTMRLFWIRIKVCWRIMTRKYDHWVIIYLDKPNLLKSLKYQDYQSKATAHHIHPYMMHKLIKDVAATKDDIDRSLDKAAFEGEVEIFKNKS